MNRTVMTFIIVCSLPALSFAKDKDWKTGTLLDLSSQHNTVSTGAPTNAFVSSSYTNPDTASSVKCSYAIDAGQYVYVLDNTLWGRWQKDPGLTVNGPVEYAIQGKHIFVKDESGTVRKVSIDKKILK